MRPSFPRLLTILTRDAVPKHAQGKVIPNLPRLSEQTPTPTLIELLIARKEMKERLVVGALGEQQQQQQEERSTGDEKEGATSASASMEKPWPTNLRIEPVVKREQFSQIHQSVRMQVKEALKER